MNKIIDFDELINKLSKCCFGTNVCGYCKNEKCLIGYCKTSITSCIKTDNEFVENGVEKIPFSDSKIYDDSSLTDCLAAVLNQCSNCSLYHDDDCIVNVIRSVLEVALIGESLKYTGSVLVYLEDLKQKDRDLYEKVFSMYKEKRNVNYEKTEEKLSCKKTQNTDLQKHITQNFNGETKEAGIYLAMSMQAEKLGYNHIAQKLKEIAFEEVYHAANFATLNGMLKEDLFDNIKLMLKGELFAVSDKNNISEKAKIKGLMETSNYFKKASKDEERHASILKELLNENNVF